MLRETGSENGSENWKKFLRKHWNIVALFAVVGIVAFVGAIYVYLWFVADAQATNMVPTSLGLWTMGYLVTFILHLIFWELLFIGVPAGLGALAGWRWWRKLLDEEKAEYHFFGKRSRTTSGGSGVSVFFYCILHQDFHRWELECGFCNLDFKLCCRFHDFNTSRGSHYFRNSDSYRNHLVDTS
ncbi:MAG: hypothetical protein QG670_126 [Thermoproteota archaeon]|nr:hypothetical protein [Thermoproteota archaeon]